MYFNCGFWSATEDCLTPPIGRVYEKLTHKWGKKQTENVEVSRNYYLGCLFF